MNWKNTVWNVECDSVCGILQAKYYDKDKKAHKQTLYFPDPYDDYGVNRLAEPSYYPEEETVIFMEDEVYWSSSLGRVPRVNDSMLYTSPVAKGPFYPFAELLIKNTI